MFSAATDRFAIVTQLGTNTLLRHFGSLLDCARAAQDADDFEHRLTTAGFVSSTAIRYCDDLVTIISGAEGRELSRRDIFPLLRVINVLSLDLSSGTRQAEASIKSLLSYTAIPEDKADSARQTWNELVSVAAEGEAASEVVRQDGSPRDGQATPRNVRLRASDAYRAP